MTMIVHQMDAKIDSMIIFIHIYKKFDFIK